MEELTLLEDMRLYSGVHQITDEASYAWLNPGQYADFYVFDENHPGELAQIVPNSFTREDIEPYVLVELLGDDALVNKISFYATDGVGRTEIADGTLNSNNYFTDDHGYTEVTKVVFAEEIHPTNMASAFEEMTEMKAIEGIEKLHTERVTSMQRAFYDCYNYDGPWI